MSFLGSAFGAAGRAGMSVGYGMHAGLDALRHPLRTGVKGAWSATKGAAGLGASAALGATGLGLHAAIKYGPGAYRKTSALTQATVGASLTEIGAVSALGLGAYAAMSDNPDEGLMEAGRTVASMGEQMGMASRPSYGTSVFQQSAQGLVFGLHSRRGR